MIPIFKTAHELCLTPTETDILNWLETNLPHCLHMDLKELSAKLYTSNATIVRFCQKLGFRGFNEFKYQIRRQLQIENEAPYFSDAIIGSNLAQFRDNLEQLDFAALHEAANLITSERPIYIYGTNLSSILAHYLQNVLNSLDYGCILIEWKQLLNTLVDEISSDSILFLISAHGESSLYQTVLEKTKERRITTILLTCDPDTPLIPLSTYAFCSNDINRKLHQVDINPRIGLFTIIQLLIDIIAHQKELTNH